MRSADVIVVGTGAAGLFHALFLPKDYRVIMITKTEVEKVIPFWRREEFPHCAMKKITTCTLKTP